MSHVFCCLNLYCLQIDNSQNSIYPTVPASYAKAAKDEESDILPPFEELHVPDGQLLCPYLAKGVCPYESECEYIHGDVCEMCGLAVLHPTDNSQREEHAKVRATF